MPSITCTQMSGARTLMVTAMWGAFNSGYGRVWATTAPTSAPTPQCFEQMASIAYAGRTWSNVRAVDDDVDDVGAWSARCAGSSVAEYSTNDYDGSLCLCMALCLATDCNAVEWEDKSAHKCKLYTSQQTDTGVNAQWCVLLYIVETHSY